MRPEKSTVWVGWMDGVMKGGARSDFLAWVMSRTKTGLLGWECCSRWCGLGCIAKLLEFFLSLDVL